MQARCSQKACAYPVERDGLCVFHLRDKGTTEFNIAPVILETVEVEETMVTIEEKCYCGRPKGHTGRHIGSPQKKDSTIPIVHKPRAATSDISTEEIIAELKKRRDKLTLAIEALESD